MYCSSCGIPIDAAVAVCDGCGRPVAAAPPAVAAAGGSSRAPVVPLAARPLEKGGADAALLVFCSGPRAGERLELRAGAAVTIGRGQECAVVLDHPSVSRAHARITQGSAGYLIEDVGSRNGTWVNGAPISPPHPLRSGDVLRLGDVELEFHVPRATAAQAPAGDHLLLADGQQVPLVGRDLYIGRAGTNHIVLDDVTISRQHARLQRVPQGWLLIDLGSSNGTQVNSQPLGGSVLLASGDMIQFGRVAAMFRPAPAVDGADDRPLH